MSCKNGPALVSLPVSRTAGSSHGKCGLMNRMVVWGEFMLSPYRCERCVFMATIPEEEGLKNLPW